MRVLQYTEISNISSDKINILGRMGKKRQPLPIFFNGGGVEVVVTGSELWIDLETDSDVNEMWVALEINGAFIARQMLLPGEHSLCLFRSMEPSTPKRVRLYRELQAMNDDPKVKLLIKGFKHDGDFQNVPVYKRKLEFIGDSITSGEGSYGAFDDVDWIPMYMSASQNFATMTAKALNADYHLISQGGWGVFCGWDNDVRHNLPSVYEKVCGLANGAMNEELGAQDEYDFASWQPDAIIVNLGTNDVTSFNQPEFVNPEDGKTYKMRTNSDGTRNREDELKIVSAIIDFLTMLRKHNPKAQIVWSYGMLGCDLNLVITEGINKYKEKAGDENISYFQLPNTTMETFGSHMHPGPKSHQNAAKELIDYLKNKLGWSE